MTDTTNPAVAPLELPANLADVNERIEEVKAKIDDLKRESKRISDEIFNLRERHLYPLVAVQKQLHTMNSTSAS